MKNYQATLLIPTYERTAYLKRQVTYLKKYFDLSAIKVIVLDGSTHCIDLNHKICQKAKIEYRHYGPESHYLDRLLDGLNSTTTEYVNILADDDLLNPVGYFEALEFLKEHADYSCAHGKYIGFILKEDVNPDTPEFESNHSLYLERAKLVTFHRMYIGGSSAEENTISERVINFMGRYIPNFYGVHRTSVMLEAIELSKQYVDLSDYHLMEILPAEISLVAGKEKILPSFYMARQGEQSLSGDLKKVETLEEYVLSKRFAARHRRHQEAISVYATKNGILHENLPRAIDISTAHYLFRYCLVEEIVHKFCNFISYQIPDDIQLQLSGYRQAYCQADNRVDFAASEHETFINFLKKYYALPITGALKKFLTQKWYEIGLNLF